MEMPGTAEREGENTDGVKHGRKAWLPMLHSCYKISLNSALGHPDLYGWLILESKPNECEGTAPASSSQEKSLNLRIKAKEKTSENTFKDKTKQKKPEQTCLSRICHQIE